MPLRRLKLNKCWPQERVSRLIKLWNKGVNARECASQLGVTRNAVLGKLYRIRQEHGIYVRRAAWSERFL